MAKQLEESEISILPLQLAFSAHINQLMFTFSKQLVIENNKCPSSLQQNVCVFNQMQMWVLPTFLSYLFSSVVTVSRTYFTATIDTGNTLLQITFDFSTNMKVHVQICEDVTHLNLHVCACRLAIYVETYVCKKALVLY